MKKTDRAIAIIGFRRPAHLRDTLRALANNYDIAGTPVHMFIDGPREHAREAAKEKKLVEETRALCRAFPWSGAHTVHASKKNLGLQQNVRRAIDTVLSDYKQVIVVEDDIITSPYAYRFFARGLSRFAEDKKVSAVCGHCYPFDRKIFNPTAPYFLRHFACWGWATWRRAWERVCWDTGALRKNLAKSRAVQTLDFGNARWVSGILEAQHGGYINTWDVQTGVSFFLDGGLCLYPPETLTNNSGWRNDGLSTHVVSAVNPNAPLAYADFSVPENIPVEENPRARKAYSALVCPPRVRLKNYVRAPIMAFKTLTKKLLHANKSKNIK